MKLPAILIAGMLMSIHVAFSQSPQAFKYQAVARDSTGTVLSNTAINLRISIIKGSAYGSAIYTESHNATTNSLGLINLEIGTGSFITGSFSNIDWGADKYFVKVEMDATGGNNYITMGISQLLSVPYALYAEKAGNVKWQVNSPYLYYNGGKVGLGTNTPVTDLHVVNTADHALLRVQGMYKQGGIQLMSGNGYSPFINFSSNEVPGSGGTFFYDGYNKRLVLRTYEHTETSREMVLHESGNLGLGVRLPAFKLDINGDINFTGKLYRNGQIFNINPFWDSNDSGDIYFKNAKVGIGSTDPKTDLHIVSNYDHALLRVQSQTKQGGIQLMAGTGYSPFVNFTTTEFPGEGATIFYQGDNKQLVFRTYHVTEMEREMVLHESGNLGLGKKLPAFKLDVNGDINFSGNLYKNGQLFKPEEIWTKNDSTVFVSNTFVGIGTATPKAKLEISDGDIYINNPEKGIILKSPNGQCWRVTIDNEGTFVKTAINCPEVHEEM